MNFLSAAIRFLMVALFLMSGRAIASDLPVIGAYLKIPGVPGDMNLEGDQEEYFRVITWHLNLTRDPSSKLGGMCPLEMGIKIFGNGPEISLANAMLSGTVYPQATLTFTFGHKRREASGGPPPSQELASGNIPLNFATTVYTFFNVQVVGYKQMGGGSGLFQELDVESQLIPGGTIPKPVTQFAIAFEKLSAQVVPTSGEQTEGGTYTVNGPRINKKRSKRNGCPPFEY